MKVTVVGAGRAGTAVAVLLRRAGHDIVAVSGRDGTRQRVAAHLPGVPVVDPVEAVAAADLVVIATPDDAIEATVTALSAAAAVPHGAWVAHLSGSLGLDVLAPLRDLGARRLAIHPLQTFPDATSAIDRLPGSAVAVTADDDEGHALGERLARDVGGEPFRLADDRRALYHAAAVFASNYLVTSSAVAAALLRAADVPDPAAAMAPLQRATLENVASMGPADALTGPAVRGDAGTIRRHLEALRTHAPEAVAAYVAMARATLDLAERAGRLDAPSRAAVEDVLTSWT